MAAVLMASAIYVGYVAGALVGGWTAAEQVGEEFHRLLAALEN